MYFLPKTLADVAQEPNRVDTPTYQQQFLYAGVYKEPNSGLQSLYPCNCVLYAKSILGITESLGIAGNIKPSRLNPYIGGLVITSEGPLGHVAIVTDIKNGFLYLQEANYHHCQITTGRTLSIDSPIIKGYY